MKLTLVSVFTAVFLVGCGGDSIPTQSPESEINIESQEGESSITIHNIYSPNLGAEVECIVLVSSATYKRGAGISCDWP